MKERFIVRLSLAGSVLGIVAIYIIVSHMNYGAVKIGSLTGEMIGQTVNVTGVVSGVYVHKDGHVFFTLSDDGEEIRVVIWSDMARKLDTEFGNGMTANVIGNLELYKGELEIITRDARII